MEKRFRINQIQPDAYRALLAIENYLNKSSLDKGQLCFNKTSGFTIKWLSFCLHSHFQEFLQHGAINNPFNFS